MEKKPITVELDQFPATFWPLLQAGPVFDSSCSNAARVYFIDRDGGYYLKNMAKAALRREAEMTRYFHSKGFSAQVLAYESLDSDWMLTRRVPGEDCTHPSYLEDPCRLADMLGTLLRMLHDTATQDCPVDRTAEYLATAKRNYRSRHYDASLFPDNWGYASAEDAWRVIEDNEKYLASDVLLHGDYCLPNIILNVWRFSGFIDLDSAGVGDRHIDLFWGIWSLGFNLKTDRFRDRFLDAYGRDKVNEDIFPVIAACEVFG